MKLYYMKNSYRADCGSQQRDRKPGQSIKEHLTPTGAAAVWEQNVACLEDCMHVFSRGETHFPSITEGSFGFITRLDVDVTCA